MFLVRIRFIAFPSPAINTFTVGKPQNYTVATVEKNVKEETGYAVKLNQDNVKIYSLESVDEMIMRFAEVLPELKLIKEGLWEQY